MALFAFESYGASLERSKLPKSVSQCLQDAFEMVISYGIVRVI